MPHQLPQSFRRACERKRRPIFITIFIGAGKEMVRRPLGFLRHVADLFGLPAILPGGPKPVAGATRRRVPIARPIPFRSVFIISGSSDPPPTEPTWSDALQVIDKEHHLTGYDQGRRLSVIASILLVSRAHARTAAPVPADQQMRWIFPPLRAGTTSFQRQAPSLWLMMSIIGFDP